MYAHEQEIALRGGNVGGAVLAGDTVRRPTGPWTPAVHALLAHLGGQGLPHIPRVRGIDDRGREVLDYLPGRVVDIEAEPFSHGQLAALARWARQLHAAVAGFAHPGPWRFAPDPRGTLICHNDIAPRNACYDGEDLVGVFDWDCAGPSTPLLELAFIAWSGAPLYRVNDPAEDAARLRVIAAGYGRYAPAEILSAVPSRIRAMVAGIQAGAAAGDPGMANLIAAGEPANTARVLADLVGRIPSIIAAL
jgi:Ser/Thr protein kinase RdoA (MazF antagonist)